MSDLPSAIAGLNTVDIEGDPIDALDACLMVLEAMAFRPKNRLNEYVFTEDEQYEQYQKNLKNFFFKVIYIKQLKKLATKKTATNS